MPTPFMHALLVALLLCTACAEGQDRRPAPTQAAPEAPLAPSTPAKASAPDNGLHRQLAETYGRYRDGRITRKRFKHKDIAPIVKQLGAPFEVRMEGKSVEGREIYSVKVGTGPVQVLLWSQMHGDEPTATMALLDMFRFLAADDEFNPLRQMMLSELSICFIPLLNPDGAERFQRRNALGIDLNRDAARLQMPESKILKRLRDQTDADWGFNLHDQSRYYAAGQNAKTASVSFLAPAYNLEKDINDKRGEAMQLIGLMSTLLEHYIPGQMARYDDTFEPRAFGDNIQKWGTRTILVEAGGLKGDDENQELRRLHYLLLMNALADIATRRYEDTDRSAYDALPLNNSNAFFDLIVQEVEVQQGGLRYTTDIGFRYSEPGMNKKQGAYSSASIGDVGDLSVFYGYEVLQGKGLKAVYGKVYPQKIVGETALRNLNPAKLLREGYTSVQVADVPKKILQAALPLRLLTGGAPGMSPVLPGQNPDLLLQKEGAVRWAVINGRAFEVSSLGTSLGSVLDGK